MSSIGAPCKKCNDEGPLHVEKEGHLADWKVSCKVCGFVDKDGSYWDYYLGGWEAHCKSLNWNPNERD